MSRRAFLRAAVLALVFPTAAHAKKPPHPPHPHQPPVSAQTGGLPLLLSHT
jgi:hypothetical protein